MMRGYALSGWSSCGSCMRRHGLPKSNNARRRLPRWRKLMTYSSLLPLLQARSASQCNTWLLLACKLLAYKCRMPR